MRVELADGPTVQFSGDLGRPHHPLLVPPAPVGDCDHLVVESTYGDREHTTVGPARHSPTVIERTVDRGGKLIIPAFAVDRTEVLLYHLRQLADEGRLPRVPIFVDSPMALAALQIYREAFEEHATDLRPDLPHPTTLFDLPDLDEVFDSEGSKASVPHRGPAIIIAGAGHGLWRACGAPPRALPARRAQHRRARGFPGGRDARPATARRRRAA